MITITNLKKYQEESGKLLDYVKSQAKAVYIKLVDYDAILFFDLVEDTGFSGPRIKTCYHVGIMFHYDGEPIFYRHDLGDEILESIFGDDYKNLWEHAPPTNEGPMSLMHHFYFFVSKPYGYKATVLDAADQTELVKNKFMKVQKNLDS